jgi:type VI secretion system secreted protein VgrG
MSRLLEFKMPDGAGKSVLIHLTAREALGAMPEYQLMVVSNMGKLGPKDLLGKNVTAGLEMPGGRELRYFNGYVTQFSDAGSGAASWFGDEAGGQAYQYHLTVRPWLWFLTRAANFRMFQEMTVPQVVQNVCDSYPFAQLRLDLSASYRPREYLCQYRETDYNFVVRLLEQEGIYFYFEHQDGKHTMVLADSHSAHSPRAGYASIAFAENGEGHEDEEHIDAWHGSHAVTAGRFSLTDFDFTKPKVSLLGTAEKARAHDLSGFEFFDYPGEYDSVADGARYAGIRLEELQAAHQVFDAGGPVRGIEVGRIFKLANHPNHDLDHDFLVTGASFNVTNNDPGSGRDGGGSFHCTFQAIDSRIQFRAPRATPRPLVQGPQTAIVVGPAGEEIHVDQHGRVKLQFQWDRYNKADENSSCWVRVSQPWSSKGWGALFLPRIGHEVIVEFLEGDPDRPIIVGRVNNGDATSPWPLPAEKTRSGFRTRTCKGGSSNFNELSFDDKQGAEEMFIQAERDQVVRVKHDRIEDIGNESHVTVQKDAFIHLKADLNETIKGDHNAKADGSVSLKIGQDWQAKAGAKVAVDAGNEIHLKAGMKVVIEAGMSLSLKVGGNFITIDAGGVYIKGALVQINSGGAAGSGAGAAPIAPKEAKQPRTSQGGTDPAPVAPAAPASYSPQAASLRLAWKAGAPFCAQCEAAAAANA